MNARFLVGDPILAAGFLDSSSSALTFGCSPSPFFRVQCLAFWISPKSLLPGALPGMVYFSGFVWPAKALSLLQKFQASVSSYGRDCLTGTFWWARNSVRAQTPTLCLQKVMTHCFSHAVPVLCAVSLETTIRLPY